MAKKVLVAYDGSPAAKKALDIVKRFAIIDPTLEIVLASVFRLYSTGSAAAGIDSIYMDEVAPIKDKLDEIANSLPNKVDVRILKGSSPAPLIVQCAKDENCDLIVMGSRGMGGVKGYLGSVSYAVTRDSPVSVLIAKEDHGE